MPIEERVPYYSQKWRHFLRPICQNIFDWKTTSYSYPENNHRVMLLSCRLPAWFSFPYLFCWTLLQSCYSNCIAAYYRKYILCCRGIIVATTSSNVQILIESDEWFSPFSLSEPLVERWAFEWRAKREIQKMNAWASAIQGKKLSGERIANLAKMSECPALLTYPTYPTYLTYLTYCTFQIL
jgi:hypothetical protein